MKFNILSTKNRFNTAEPATPAGGKGVIPLAGADLEPRNKKQLALWAVATLFVLVVLGIILWKMGIFGLIKPMESPEEVSVIKKEYQTVQSDTVESNIMINSATPGLLRIGYNLRDEDGNVIPLNYPNIDARIRYIGSDEFSVLDTNFGDDGSSVFMYQLWPPVPPGINYIRIYNEDGTIFETTFEWLGLAGMVNVNVLHGQSSVGVEFPDFSLEQAERFIYMRPDGTTEEFGEEFASSTYTISTEGIQNGFHIFLVKMPNDETWYYRDMTYPDDFK